MICVYCNSKFYRMDNKDGSCASSPQPNKRHMKLQAVGWLEEAAAEISKSAAAFKLVPYKAGLDPMVKEFKRISSTLRKERLNTTGITTIPSHIKYKYSQFWDHLVRQQYSDDGSVEPLKEDTWDIHIKNLDEFIDFYNKDWYMATKYSVFARHFVFLDWLLTNHKQKTIKFCDRVAKRTLLHFAVLNGDILKVQVLLCNGIDVNAADSNGRSALYMSLNFPRSIHPVTIIEELLDNGADINQKTKSGFSILHRACLNGDLPVILLLIKRRAKVYTLDKKNLVPIEYFKGSDQEKKELRLIYNENIRFSGKKDHIKMWAHVISKAFVGELLTSIQPLCAVCKRRLSACSVLRKENYRYWILVHKRFDIK